MPGEVLPPPRSLLYVKPVPEDQGGGWEIGCDCGMVTQLIPEGLGELTEAVEQAFTCDGCQSVHWFTVGPAILPGKPNPGSDEALAMGCKCSAAVNDHGRTPPEPPDGWWISEQCTVHCPLAPN